MRISYPGLFGDEDVADLFCGGGGATPGLEMGLGRRVNYAVNHDAVALAVHKLNFPRTRQLEADLWEARPKDVTRGRDLGVLWASPDCTHFSHAKGDVPREKNIRALAWVVIKWAKAVRPRTIFLENVREFEGWGPLNEDGRPDPNRRGETFYQWVHSLEHLGYEVQWRMLDSAAFGAPTRRRRLFIVARCDGKEIRWPEPTHGNGLIPERTASECIDWGLPCPSIFERRKPLAEKTLLRIAEGIRRYVTETDYPFLVRVDGDLAVPTLIQTGYGERQGQTPRVPGLEKPLGTVVAGGQKHALVAAFVSKYYGTGIGSPPDQPLGTITAQGQKHALVAAFLGKHYGGVVGHSLRRPIGTITSRDHHSLITAGLKRPRRGSRADHRSEVRAFLTSYYSSGSVGQSLHAPLRTITSKARFGLVIIEGQEYEITDISLRMLQPHELLVAQFGDYAEGYSFDTVVERRNGRIAPITKTEKVRLIGNSVPPNVVRALVTANAA